MTQFTPDELKKQNSGKYNDWKFARNGKGEWVGSSGKITGHIVSIFNEKGEEYPDIKFHNLTSTGGYGLNIWGQAIKSFGKNFSSPKLKAQFPFCQKCKREYSNSVKKCNLCKIDLNS